MFPSKDEAQEKIDKWRAMAAQGGYDADTHIVDPQAHYTMMDEIERSIVTLSEYYRCGGTYRTWSPRKADDLRYPTWNPMISPRILEIVGEFTSDDAVTSRPCVASLCDIYTVLLGVIKGIRNLDRHQRFFSVLFERAEDTVAEFIRIDVNALTTFKHTIEVAIDVAYALEPADPIEAAEGMAECLTGAVEDMLAIFHCSQLIHVVNNNHQILDLGRMLVYMLDLGLVCYAGSHASRFDVIYLDQDTDAVSLALDSGLSFHCSRRPLACLGGFLDSKSVWVFRIGGDSSNTTTVTSKSKLSILTDIGTLADVWGPVWAEGVDGGEKEQVKKYHVSKGCIRRVRGGTSTEFPGAIQCHWYSWPQDYMRRFSSLITRADTFTMNLNDKLLIGTDLRVNRSCEYTLPEYEMNYGHMMRTLGPGPSTWRLDGATVAVQLSAPRVVSFQIQGNVKKVPETTVKQFILDKWRFQPERANPGIFNSFFGVEISHCTGNARRVPFKDIFLMDSVQDFLERQIPGWKYTNWGVDFVKALQTQSNEAIFAFWTKHVLNRAQVGQIVRSVLDVLDSTGKSESGLRAAFLHQNSEVGIDLPDTGNEWSHLLKDSYLTATYAIINNTCLEYRRPDHTTCICNDETRFTVLQTQLGLRRGEELRERVKVEPNPQTYKRVDNDRIIRGVPYFLTPEISLKRTLLGNYRLAIAKELSDQSGLPLENLVKVAVRASGKSYGGMEIPRDRTLTKVLAGHQQLADQNVTDGTLAVQEGLTQLEIESIMKEDINAQRLLEEELMCRN